MEHVAADEVGSLKDNSKACKWSPQSAYVMLEIKQQKTEKDTIMK